MAATTNSDTVNIVLVHGGFVDGSGWEAVLADDVRAARRVVTAQDGPVILVGHSYGGAAAFMADSQVPWGVEALSGSISKPAWKSKPSWYLAKSTEALAHVG
jgi:pimeloyl-ACP methyl ester carboxylesterase